MRIKTALCLILALALIGWGLFWFQDKLIPEPEEIRIYHPHRTTPGLTHFKIQRCNNDNACINKVFGVG